METTRKNLGLVISWNCHPDQHAINRLDEWRRFEFQTESEANEGCRRRGPLPVLSLDQPPHICRKYRPWPKEFPGARYWPWLTIERRMDEEIRLRHGPHFQGLEEFADMATNPEPATIRGKPNPSYMGGKLTKKVAPKQIHLSSHLHPAARFPLYVVEPRPTLTKVGNKAKGCGQKMTPCKPHKDNMSYFNFVNASWII